jgi:hypothetical protein
MTHRNSAFIAGMACRGLAEHDPQAAAELKAAMGREDLAGFNRGWEAWTHRPRHERRSDLEALYEAVGVA